MEIHIVMIAVNCGRIARVALESFFQHHKGYKINVVGTEVDFLDAGKIIRHPDVILSPIAADSPVIKSFQKGHEGTATIVANALYNMSKLKLKVVFLDSDLYFKRECMSIMERAFDEGNHIIGSRRCFGNNPSGIKGLEGFQDTIATYFMGIDTTYFPSDFNMEELIKMCQGVEHPLKFPVLDFFDPVVHVMLQRGAKIKYLDNNLVGGQNAAGKKINAFPSNMHMDCGSCLVHFGGVGSGLAYQKGLSSPEQSYATWALGRFALYSKLFFFSNERQVIISSEETVYGTDGRWINGSYDQKILDQINKDIQ